MMKRISDFISLDRAKPFVLYSLDFSYLLKRLWVRLSGDAQTFHIQSFNTNTQSSPPALSFPEKTTCQSNVESSNHYSGLLNDITSSSLEEISQASHFTEHSCSESNLKFIAWIRKQLRSFPYWLRGHLSLADLSLRSNDIQTAYLSSYAVLTINSHDIRALYYLGKCYLRKNCYEKAVHLFESALKQNAVNEQASLKYLIQEELAASYIPLERFQEAKDLLKCIPEKYRNHSIQSSLSYLEMKCPS
jgi:tetratricopeptide (TPR) repeat protein